MDVTFMNECSKSSSSRGVSTLYYTSWILHEMAKRRFIGSDFIHRHLLSKDEIYSATVLRGLACRGWSRDIKLD